MDLYYYKAKLLKIVDGDTIDVELSLGLDVYRQERLRVAHINTPETYGVKKDSEEYKQGLAAKQRLTELLGEGELYVRTIKDKKGKYGRYLAELFVNDTNVGETLVKEGFAEKYE